MKKYKVLIIGLVLIVIIAVAGILSQKKSLGSDFKNSTFTVEGVPVTLVNGVSTMPAAPGSASVVTTRYFGNEATGDLNGDGKTDAAFLITQDSGGSGTFYYVVAELQTSKGYQPTSALFVGDRIAPQTTEIRDGEVVVNYADRKPSDPMSAPPSVGMTKYFKVTNGVFGPVM